MQRIPPILSSIKEKKIEKKGEEYTGSTFDESSDDEGK